MREDSHQSLANFYFDRRLDMVRFALLRLGHNASLLHHTAISPRAAIANGRLVAIQFNDRIVDPVAGEGCQHMFDGMNLGAALGQSGRASRLTDIFNVRLDLRLSLEVAAPKTNACIRRGPRKNHIDPVATVQANARQADWLTKGLLLEHNYD